MQVVKGCDHVSQPSPFFSTGSDDIFVGGESFPHSEDEKPDVQDDSEEEAWLNALETGGVNARGYLPQKRDPTSLTARQVHMCIHRLVQTRLLATISYCAESC